MKDLSPTASDIEQLAAIWTKGCETCPSFPDRGEERWHNDTLYFDGFFFDDGGQRIDEPTRQNQINRFRSQLLSYSNDPATHFSSLDLALSAKLVCQYQESALNPTVSCESAVEQAHSLLQRMPAIPL